MKWWILVIGVYAMLGTGLVYQAHQSDLKNRPRSVFRDECRIDQGIPAETTFNDLYCLYPKESKIKRFE